MKALWRSGKACTGLEIQDALVTHFDQPELALTTVLTVLTRLSDKGLVNRVPGGGRGVKFEAATTREQHSAQALVNILRAESDAELTLSHFVGSLSPEQRDALTKALQAEGSQAPAGHPES